MSTRLGCNGCHEKNGGGGIFMENPQVGRVVAPNLTERRRLYDDAAFAALLHEGTTHDGHPPLGMPIHMFQYLSHGEVRDVTAWLRSLPEVATPLPKTEYSAPIAKATTPFGSTSTSVSAEAKARPRRRVVSVMRPCWHAVA